MQGFIYNMVNNKWRNGMQLWGGKWFKRILASLLRLIKCSLMTVKIRTAVTKQNWTRIFELNKVFWETFVSTNIIRFEPEIWFVMLPCLNGTKS